MKLAWISVALALAAVQASAAGPALAAQRWDWNKAPAPAAPPATITPKPDPCAPGPDDTTAKTCPAADALPDTDLQDSLAPPKVAGSTGNNRAKKASQ